MSSMQQALNGQLYNAIPLADNGVHQSMANGTPIPAGTISGQASYIQPEYTAPLVAGQPGVGQYNHAPPPNANNDAAHAQPPAATTEAYASSPEVPIDRLMAGTHISPAPTNNRTTQARPLVNPPNRITVDRRSGRSGRTSILQTVLKPFGSRLIKPGKPQPAGSPELRADEKVYDSCNVRQRVIEGIRVYDMNPRAVSTSEHFIPAAVFDIRPEAAAVRTRRRDVEEREAQEAAHEEAQITARDFATAPIGRRRRRRRKQIFYFAGGGWQNPPSPEHWKLCAHLCTEMHRRGQPATVSLVSYPLAPNSPGVDAFEMLVPWYHEALAAPPTQEDLAEMQELSRVNTNATSSSLGLARTATNATGVSLFKTTSRRLLSRHVEEEDIIFAGDSAGGNVALALTMHVLSTDPSARAPSSLLLVSPAVDLRNTNPAMKEVEKKDPMLSVQYVNGTAAAWCGKGGDANDPRLSPLLGDASVLAERGVVVNGIVGTYDVLAPDAVLFREKCEAAGVKGRWLEWEKQMHAFPLAFAYKVVKEAAEAVDWMVDVLVDKQTT